MSHNERFNNYKYKGNDFLELPPPPPGEGKNNLRQETSNLISYLLDIFYPKLIFLYRAENF